MAGLPTSAFGASANAGLLAFFKVRYPQRKVEELVTWGNPTLSAISRSDELTGIHTVIPMQITIPQGISASLTTAINAASPVQGKAWNITTGQLYGGLRIDAKTLMAARNDQGAFFRLREKEYAGELKGIGLALEKQLWASGNASVGVASATLTTGALGSVTLATSADALNFLVGMKVQFYAESGAAPGNPDVSVEHNTGEAAAGYSTVTKVNLYTGKIDFDVVPTDVVATDHLVRAGAFAGTESDGDSLGDIRGIPAWIPSADPGATAFFGVDRSVAPQMLGGWRLPSFLGTIEETAKKLASVMDRVSQNPKTLWLSHSNFNRLENELGARGMREEDGGSAQFGRSSLRMSTPAGAVMIKAGPFVPEDAGFLLDMSTWKLMSLGAVPHLVDDDGLTARVVGVTDISGSSAALDGIEIRLRAFPQLVCMNPFANGRFPIV